MRRFIFKVEEEIWKDIVLYEGLYKISNMGNVYSCRSKKLLKPSKDASGAYLGVILYKNGKTKRFTIHKLVALHFVDNPYNYPIINHKDENIYNNSYKNLQWCTHKYNNTYNNRHKRIGRKISEVIRQKGGQHNKGCTLSEELKTRIRNSILKRPTQFYGNQYVDKNHRKIKHI